MRGSFIAILLLPLVMLFISFSPARKEEGLKVNITNLRNNKGHVLVSLFKEGEGFPSDTEKAIRKGKAIIKDNTAWIIFTGLPTGNYAVAILHDENDDMKMNKNGLGIPKEGYGFSNNVMGTFGPPSYSRASFRFSNNTFSVVNIKTKY